MREQRLPLTVILLTLMIDAMGIGLIIPVLPALVGSFTDSAAGQAFWYGAVAFANPMKNRNPPTKSAG